MGVPRWIRAYAALFLALSVVGLLTPLIGFALVAGWLGNGWLGLARPRVTALGLLILALGPLLALPWALYRRGAQELCAVENGPFLVCYYALLSLFFLVGCLCVASWHWIVGSS
jgi:hypothetical protein